MPRNPARPLLHIGYHKTATTWMQRDLFQESGGSFSAPWSRREVAERVISVNPFAFDPVAAAAFFAEGIETTMQRDLVPVLTNEQLAGNAHTGGHNSRSIADRLASSLPGARVLIVIREQQSMVLSAYKQYVRACGAASLRRYLDPPQRGNDRGVPFFDPAFLEYHRLIAYYVALFGADNVLVLPFEALCADAIGFVGQIADFAGARRPERVPMSPRNATISAAAVALKRPVNLLLVRDALNPLAPVDSMRVAGRVKAVFDQIDRWLPATVRHAADERMRRSIAERFTGRFAASNRATESLTRLDLASHGYET